MFIKQIIIQGFKSYKDQTVIEPFSPKHNVIVGRNGSGKSNFFAAIRFVLSDAYTQMDREARQALLHEGAGSAVMSAYVEVIFDNSDERFPTGTKEVILRRSIGNKKDEYSLNRKNTTKTEVMNLLESAGFSRSNPYYIVPQGRVTTITNMKDQERLEMLKEVAGTHVYETRRSESHKIMEETSHKREKIDDLLQHIRGRLAELEEEKEELRAFQDKDRERRCLEYTIHRKDQDALQEALDRESGLRENGGDQNDANRAAADEGERELEAIEKEISELQQQLKVLLQDKEQLKDEYADGSRKKAQLEMDVQAMVDNQAAAQQARTQHASELSHVQTEIKEREAELAQLTPEYTAKHDEEKLLKERLTTAEATQQRLYAKQGRHTHFKSKRDRDQFLQNEISEVNGALGKRKAVVLDTTEEITDLETQIGKLDNEVAGMRDRLENRGDDQQSIAAQVQKAKDEQHHLSDQRKELWREEAKLESVIENARSELDKAEKFLSRMMDGNVTRGLQNVRKIVKEQKIQGTHGTLGELFEFNDKYKTAIEVTAGTSLFDYVVDNDQIAARLSEELRKHKLGRVTFVPLAQLKDRQVDLPKASDAIPLLSKLRYESKYERAFQQVFGKTIVCPDLRVASQYARSHGVSAITPEGDRSDKKGALTGGYHDTRNSRIDTMVREKKAREDVESNVHRRQEIRDQLDAIDQQVTKAMSTVTKLEQQRIQKESGYEPLRIEIQRQQHSLNQRRDELQQKQRQLENVQESVRALGEQLSGYQTELAGDFKKALSNEEQRQLDSIISELPQLKKQVAKISSERTTLETRKSDIESLLRENLRLRLDQLQSVDIEGGASSGGASGGRLKELQRELKRSNATLKKAAETINQNEDAIEKAQGELQDAQRRRGEKQSEVERLRNTVVNFQKILEKAKVKQSHLTQRLEEVQNSIRILGALPDAAFTPQYGNMAANVATSRLHKVQEALKKYGHVNKKAFEQFAQFEQQRGLLESRRKELDNSDTSIRELIDVLDQRKDEAIERTFKQVSREFASIFERLVPAGKGRLVIQRRSDQAARAGDSDSEDERPANSVENYTGVGISVSFNSKHDEQQRIQQLSGGQKALCALTLVFAIQASDPAPFYLFDEIDANLDAQYRTAVAQLLQESAETGQFICTTFRPEMLRVAEKCYGVNFVRKTSSIDAVSRTEALKFVEEAVKG